MWKYAIYRRLGKLEHTAAAAAPAAAPAAAAKLFIHFYQSPALVLGHELSAGTRGKAVTWRSVTELRVVGQKENYEAQVQDPLGADGCGRNEPKALNVFVPSKKVSGFMRCVF